MWAKASLKKKKSWLEGTCLHRGNGLIFSWANFGLETQGQAWMYQPPRPIDLQKRKMLWYSGILHRWSTIFGWNYRVKSRQQETQTTNKLKPSIHRTSCFHEDPRFGMPRGSRVCFNFRLAESCSEIIIPWKPPKTGGRELCISRDMLKGVTVIPCYSNQNQVLSWEFSLFLAGTTVARSMASLWISDGPQSYSSVYRFRLNNALSSCHGHPHSQCAYTWHDIVQSPSEVWGCLLDSRRSPWRPSHKHNKSKGLEPKDSDPGFIAIVASAMGRLPTAIENTTAVFFFDGGITAAKSFLKKNIPRDSTRVTAKFYHAPSAPNVWNIYIPTLRVKIYGRCRKIFHTWIWANMWANYTTCYEI